MLHKSEFKMASEMFEYRNVSDEQIFRQMAIDLLNKMPMSELHKLLSFNKIDPNSEEFKNKIRDNETTNTERMRLYNLQQQQVVLYEVEVSL